MQFPHKLLLALCYETVWFIDVLFKIAIQEQFLNSQLLYFQIEMHRNGQEYFDGF